MTAEIPFHYQTDDARYSIDVIRDSRDEDQPHYDVDLVRSRSGHFGEAIEQRLTLAEYDDRDEAESHRQQVEDGIAEQGLSALGDAAENVRNVPILYDGHYLFVTYPPDTEQDAPASAHLLHLDELSIQSASLGQGTAIEMNAIAANGEQSLLAGQLITVPENEPARHVDGGGTAHWFAIVERDEPQEESYELRYFRNLDLDDGTQRSDSYPVMPLANDEPQSAWALPGLEMYLEKGDVYMAQQFAHDVADAYGQDFPEPLDLPSLNPDPEYYFGYGISENNEPSLEAVKTWMEGAERRFDTLTVGEYGTFDEGAVHELELETLKDQQGLQAAMNHAESMAVAGGYLDSQREDPRIFFEDDAPPDPFTTHRERELAEPKYAVGAISANGEHFLDVHKTWGEDSYERLTIPQPTWDDAEISTRLANTLMEQDNLQDAMQFVEALGVDAGVIDPERDDPRLFTQGPPDPFQTRREMSAPPEVDYFFDYNRFGEDALALEAHKHWTNADGSEGRDMVLLDLREGDSDGMLVETFEQEVDRLENLRVKVGLETAMHAAELLAMRNGMLDGDRVDLRLFTEGPPDPFETLAQRLEGEINPYWNTDGERIDEPKLAVENPYWRLDTIPVNDPEGEPLGHALHIVVYDSVEHDKEAVGTPIIPENEPFRMLEMAHFETTEAADKFGMEFNGYLMPGLLEGPELAEEVARLEGHPVEWKTLEGDDLRTYQDGQYTLIREPSDWHPYNPNAEHDARIDAEGLYTVYHLTTLNDDNKNEPKVKSIHSDFDL